MIIHLGKRKLVDQVMLSFDCLIPEEAHKLMDALFEEDMNDLLDELNIELGYGVSRINDKWCHDLVLFIETPRAIELHGMTIDEQLNDDYEFLEKIKDILMAKTGIEEEGS